MAQMTQGHLFDEVLVLAALGAIWLVLLGDFIIDLCTYLKGV